ncbi:Z-ring formation inhibitor MciZ [Niallia sp. Krafla_26]|uniref:Z-ring formation inhibitor MciZ n=1 Tax=Niallia sp. Krafla_26 TaxID=3064703 RepID=UPI003D168101
MKIYVHEKGITLTGKAWEVRQKLKEYRKSFELVSDWVEALSTNTSHIAYHKPALIMNYKKKNDST